MILLLDSTVLIDALRDRKGRRSLIRDLAQRGERLATSAMNVGEIYGGMLPAEERITESLLGSLEVYPVSATIARKAGSLQFAAARKGRTLGLADMIVATTALEHDLTVMTDNSKHFPVPGLKFFDLP
jgi:predicted nucleic acid-binding protein